MVKKEKTINMTMRNFGMSDYFKRMNQWQPFFYLEDWYCYQNTASPMSSENFIKAYKEFVWKK